MNRRKLHQLLLGSTLAPTAIKAAEPTGNELGPLFHSTLDFFGKLQRTKKGLYLDSYLVGKDKSSNHQCSTAAIGVGLIALCMEHEIKRNPNAQKMALQTLQTLNGMPGTREKAGFFRHFFSDRDGTGRSEHSTIDTAIMVVGALFCRNTFDDRSIHREADKLWNSINWELTLATPNGAWLHMIMEDGKPRPKSRTKLFSEYYILAWLVGERQQEEDRKGTILPFEEIPRWEDQGLQLLDDGRKKAHCSFMIQFPFFMSHPGATDPEYLKLMKAQAQADQRACSQKTNAPELWGCGAGITPTAGYHASDYQKNPGTMVSPHIIAGFIPALPLARTHLLKHWQNPDRRLKTSVGEILPRFSLDYPKWKPHRIEAIDYSSMLFGLATLHPYLGMSFFKKNTRFTFNKNKQG